MLVDLASQLLYTEWHQTAPPLAIYELTGDGMWVKPVFGALEAPGAAKTALSTLGLP